MFTSPKLILAIVATLVTISNVGAVENQKADTKWLFPGFWIPLNIPTPAPAAGGAGGATCPTATCCKRFCTGGTAPVTCTPGAGTAPPTCMGGAAMLSPNMCLSAAGGATCTAAACTTCATPCPATTVMTEATCA